MSKKLNVNITSSHIGQRLENVQNDKIFLKILKDFEIKYYTFKGFKALYYQPWTGKPVKEAL